MAKSELIGADIHCSSPEELMDTLSRRNEIWKPKPSEWVFRGIADWDFQLIPSAFRKGALDRFEFRGKRSSDGVPEADPYGFQQVQKNLESEMRLLKAFVDKLDEVGLEVPTVTPELSPEDSQRNRGRCGRLRDITAFRQDCLIGHEDLLRLRISQQRMRLELSRRYIYWQFGQFESRA